MSIRWKLTQWYGGALALVLLIFSTVVYFTMRHQLLGRIDQGLNEELADVLSEVNRASDGQGLKSWLSRRFAHHEGFDFQITTQSGERFFVNPRLESTRLPLPETTTTTKDPHLRIVTLEDGRRWRVISVQAQGPEGTLVVQVGRSLKAFDHESAELLSTFVLTGPLMLLSVLAGGYFLARRALAPVGQITTAANHITAEQLSQRIPVPNPHDELGALAQTLNQMIERLEQSFTEMQRFTADAAHELRTPLAVMRTEAEVALRTLRSPEEHARVLENLLEEINRLSQLAEQLLLLSRQDAGLYPVRNETVNLGALLEEVIGNVQMVAQEKDLRLALGDVPDCQMTTDPGLLRRVLYNLLDNAIRYSDAGGEVHVQITRQDDQVTIAIVDNGRGISPEHLSRIFDRFYRADPSRSGDGEGAGLGLAICQSCMTVLRGDISIDSTLGVGTTVRLGLPLVPPSFRA